MDTRRSPLAALLAAALALAGCGLNRPDPTTVQDLRVLGMSLAPPDLLIPQCDPGLIVGLAAAAADGGLPSLDPALVARLLLVAARPIRLTTLIADPAGEGRPLNYRLLGCSATSDRDCNAEGQYVELTRGTTGPGELSLVIAPALQILPDDAGTPLLLSVVQHDTFKGLGGIRVPLVLDLQTADAGEHIYAQKLMVYTCQFFPSQQANVTPVLPGLTWQGGADAGVEDWPEGQVRTWRGTGEVTLRPVDFSALEERYVVPSLTLSPVQLQESWKLNWLTTSGTMESYQTGGTNQAGITSRHRNAWRPDPKGVAGRVTFWVVARDGRGGESWISRQVDWSP